MHRAKDAIRRVEQVVLVEGYMDAIGVHAAGVQEVVASCGTALTTTQVRALKKHSEKIVVNFDPDTAGAKAAERSIEMLLEEGMRVRVLELEGGLDPDEYVKQHGAEVYRDKLKQASGYFLWLADRSRRKFDMRSSDGRIAGLKYLLPSIRKVSDKLERATIAEEVASYLGIDRGLVLDEFRKTAAAGSGAPVQSSAPRIPAAEKLLLNALLVSPEARLSILPKLIEMQVFEKLTARPIFDAMASMGSGTTAFHFSALEARLNDRDRDLLAGVVFADEMNEEVNALDQAWQCLRAIEAQNQELHRSSLRERVRVAERNGNFAEAMLLMEQLNQLSLKRTR